MEFSQCTPKCILEVIFIDLFLDCLIYFVLLCKCVIRDLFTHFVLV